MTSLRTKVLAGVAGLVGVATFLPAPTAGATGTGAGAAGVAPTAAGSRIEWRACPTYSDAVVGYLFPGRPLTDVRRHLARLECGTLRVPLDYRIPSGRMIDIAVTRLPATNRAQRKGSLALNPGGPGGSGRLMPVEIALGERTTAALNERYDLIGFDPRGVGYSTKVNCPEAGGGPGGGKPGEPLTEAAARKIYAAEAEANRVCSQRDPAFLGQLTSANVARDLDHIRAALHEKQIAFLGVSWGTALGAAYRSLFPERVSLMWLDSVAIPFFRLDTFERVRFAALERNASRMTEWIAERHREYGFGRTRAQVQAALVALQRRYDRKPVKFTDVDRTVDGDLVAQLSAQDGPFWPLMTEALAELRDYTSGSTAPPTLKRLLSEGAPPAPPPGAPEMGNFTMNRAVFCNEDAGSRDFSSAWSSYRERSRQTITGRIARFSAGCAGWSLPVQPVQLRKSSGSLQLSGHRWEFMSPYEWTTQMRKEIGGTVFTVDDDIHGSVFIDPTCASKMTAYFDTGRPDSSGCRGIGIGEPPSQRVQLTR